MSRGAIIHLLFLAAVAAFCIAPFCGMEQIPFRTLWNPGDDYSKVDILWKLRIPRVMMAFLAGTTLATCGMVFQAMFRNPLATPYTLGVSSGASLGAAICIQQGWNFLFLGFSSTSLSAFVGALFSVVFVYALTVGSRRGASTATMLLAGVAVSFFFSSMIIFLQYISNFTQTYQILRWVMGGLNGIVSMHDVLNVLPFAIAGSLLVWYLLLDLNLLCTGEEFAFSRGVNVQQTKLVLFLTVSMMVGAVVAICGPIGFVGLIVPHICRLLVGPDHRYLFPATWFLGGAFLVICDTVSRMIMAPTELPVGILTAFLGGPFFLWLLLARRQDIDDL